MVPDSTVEAVQDVRAALERSVAVAGERGGPIVVGGSLYLVGEARRQWLDDPLLRDPREPSREDPKA